MSAREVLDQIAQRAEAATKGPWMKDPDDPAIVLKPDRPGGWDGKAIATVWRDGYGLVEEATTEFIAASRTDVPRMEKALRAVLDELDELDQDYDSGVLWAVEHIRTVIEQHLNDETKGDDRG